MVWNGSAYCSCFVPESHWKSDRGKIMTAVTCVMISFISLCLSKVFVSGFTLWFVFSRQDNWAPTAPISNFSNRLIKLEKGSSITILFSNKFIDGIILFGHKW